MMNKAVTQYNPAVTTRETCSPVQRRESKTQIIAIYGKGGIGKSFTLANLSYMMAQQGKKVLLIGCDPKSDTTSLLFGGKACPTIIETSAKKKAAGEEVTSATSASSATASSPWNSAGPRSAAAAADAASSTASKLLEKLGFHDWDFDYVLLDFLGDVVCGGFGLPIARDMCQKVIVVGSNDLQSLYVANNVCSAVEYFRASAATSVSPAWSSTRTTAPVRRRPSAEQVGIPCWRRSPPTRTSAARAPTTRSSVARRRVGPLFAGARRSNVAEAPPQQPKPLSQDELLNLFSRRRGGPRRGAAAGDASRSVRQVDLDKPSLEVSTTMSERATRHEAAYTASEAGKRRRPIRAQ
jgi:chlorophyllide a reductase subunit X